MHGATVNAFSSVLELHCSDNKTFQLQMSNEIRFKPFTFNLTIYTLLMFFNCPYLLCLKQRYSKAKRTPLFLNRSENTLFNVVFRTRVRERINTDGVSWSRRPSSCHTHTELTCPFALILHKTRTQREEETQYKNDTGERGVKEAFLACSRVKLEPSQ